MSSGIITQARMGSTRLPGKVLLTAGGTTMLDYHLRRLRASGLPVYLATTTLPEDDVLADYARQRGLPCFRGSSDDVLSRYAATARQFGLTTIVRVTSDCPLLDGELIGRAVADYEQAANPRLYLSNGLVRTYPRGLDFEVFSAELLAEAHAHATSASDREHVTPYLHQNRSGRVEFGHVTRPRDASRFRLTLDTPPDLALLRVLLEQHRAADLSAEQLIALLEAHPELVAINAEIEQQKYDFTH
ncbi:cytidylyltransferase domain-containing protein [Hymenobacter rubripertinctus]|uniref:Acylneuraminate cytidylyltransferase n=1 Tax=Hymenobacter rubripertinctus TaxID=2029981 RepID=A0A418QVP3_9BACT|nr:glycosyltransferase family protein [Hymenobacter rubripertinctus]RIY09286.1 acylneuraminate cytidylyltransferase [Hymenobacter rubripertinctus]